MAESEQSRSKVRRTEETEIDAPADADQHVWFQSLDLTGFEPATRTSKEATRIDDHEIRFILVHEPIRTANHLPPGADWIRCTHEDEAGEGETVVTAQVAEGDTTRWAHHLLPHIRVEEYRFPSRHAA